MSLCPQSLWDAFLSPIPMPNDCTFEQYLAALEAVSNEEHREWNVNYLKELIGIKRQLQKDHVALWRIEAFDDLIKSQVEIMKDTL